MTDLRALSDAARLETIFAAFDKSGNVPMFLAATIREVRAARAASPSPATDREDAVTTEATNIEAISPFEVCPVCGSASVMRFVPDWQDGRPLPIVGCGNPWHYDYPHLMGVPSPATDPDPTAEQEAEYQAFMAERQPRLRLLDLCLTGSASGPNGEMLLCGFDNGHHGDHAWATLPTLRPSPATDAGLDEAALAKAMTAHWTNHHRDEAYPSGCVRQIAAEYRAVLATPDKGQPETWASVLEAGLLAGDDR